MSSLQSLWNRVQAAVGFPKTVDNVAVEDDRIVLRDLKTAKQFPLEPKESGRPEMDACEKCSGRLRKVVFTTAGKGDQIEIWKQYPLVIDGWVCVACGWAAAPRFISTDESVEFANQGVAHAQQEQFDDAEFWFRRILSSWPGYFAGYADLGLVLYQRSKVETDIQSKLNYRSEAEELYRRAMQADTESKSLVKVSGLFAHILALNGKESEALELLDRLAIEPSLDAETRSDNQALAENIRERS
jgi:tetratricopeptide (TPR) repeat protein